MLVGYGAHAVCPYLAFESCRQWRASPRTENLVRAGKVPDVSAETATLNYKKVGCRRGRAGAPVPACIDPLDEAACAGWQAARSRAHAHTERQQARAPHPHTPVPRVQALEKGILKILSKMGISLLSCYHGAQVGWGLPAGRHGGPAAASQHTNFQRGLGAASAAGQGSRRLCARPPAVAAVCAQPLSQPAALSLPPPPSPPLSSLPLLNLPPPHQPASLLPPSPCPDL